MAPTEAEVDALFDATRPRADAVGARYRRILPLRVASAAFGCLPIVALAAAVLSGWAARFRETPFYATSAAIVAAGLLVGALLLRRFAYADAPIHDLADREIVQPIAARLVEGAVVSHPSLEPVDWQAARLLPETHATPWRTTRVTGRIAGRAAALDEGEILFTAADDSDASWTFDGWRVRLELPFAVGGHLRVRIPLPKSHLQRERRDAFTPQAAPAARLGDARSVEVAPPGHTYAGVAEPGDVEPSALVTGAVLALLASDAGLQLAAFRRELWILVPRARDAFDGAYRSSFDRDVWRAAARSMETVEQLARAIVDAAGRS